MRVAIDGRVLQETNPTGVSRAALWQIESVRRVYPDINLVLHTRGLRSISVPSSLADVPIVHHRMPNRLSNALVTLGYDQSNFFGESDLVWQPNPMFSPTPTVPTLVTMHDLSPRIWPEFFPFKTRNWYNRWVDNFLKQAHPLVSLAAVSHRTKLDIENMYPKWKGRVYVVPPAMPTVVKVDTEQEPVHKLQLSAPYIVAVSTVEPRKNMQAVVMAHKLLRKRFPDLSLIIIGSRKSNLGLSRKDGQYSVGYLDDETRNSVLSKSLVVVYPSYYEGYGYPALEAFALGVPVIVGAAGALPESAGGAALYVSPDRAVEDIGVIVSLLHTDITFRNKVVQAGRERLQYLSGSSDPSHIVDLWKKLLSV